MGVANDQLGEMLLAEDQNLTFEAALTCSEAHERAHTERAAARQHTMVPSVQQPGG